MWAKQTFLLIFKSSSTLQCVNWQAVNDVSKDHSAFAWPWRWRATVVRNVGNFWPTYTL